MSFKLDSEFESANEITWKMYCARTVRQEESWEQSKIDAVVPQQFDWYRGDGDITISNESRRDGRYRAAQESERAGQVVVVQWERYNTYQYCSGYERNDWRETQELYYISSNSSNHFLFLLSLISNLEVYYVMISVSNTDLHRYNPANYINFVDIFYIFQIIPQIINTISAHIIDNFP